MASSHCGRNKTLPVHLAGATWQLGDPKCPLRAAHGRDRALPLGILTLKAESVLPWCWSGLACLDAEVQRAGVEYPTAECHRFCWPVELQVACPWRAVCGEAGFLGSGTYLEQSLKRPFQLQCEGALAKFMGRQCGCVLNIFDYQDQSSKWNVLLHRLLPCEESAFQLVEGLPQSQAVMPRPVFAASAVARCRAAYSAWSATRYKRVLQEGFGSEALKPYPAKSFDLNFLLQALEGYILGTKVQSLLERSVLQTAGAFAKSIGERGGAEAKAAASCWLGAPCLRSCKVSAIHSSEGQTQPSEIAQVSIMPNLLPYCAAVAARSCCHVEPEGRARLLQLGLQGASGWQEARGSGFRLGRGLRLCAFGAVATQLPARQLRGCRGAGQECCVG